MSKRQEGAETSSFASTGPLDSPFDIDSIPDAVVVADIDSGRIITGNRDREEMAQRVLDVPGVINVREIMSGKGDLRITVVGTDTDDLTRIAQGITSLGIEIDDEDLVHKEYFRPYAPFGPRDEAGASPVTGVAGLAGDADVVEIIVREQAQIAGKTLQEANEADLIPSGVLVVRINRDERTITPTGETVIKEGDFVTIHSRSGLTEETLETFAGE